MTDLEETQQDIVYALAQSRDMLYVARDSGLYRSQDNGNTWHDAFQSLKSEESFTAATVLTHEHTVFAGVKGAILRSDDAGKNWHIAGLTSPAPLVLALVISPNYAQDRLLAAGTAEDGVFISTDGGTTWGAWNFGLTDFNIYSLAISPHFGTDRAIFVGTESGIFRSHNAGRSWRETPFPMDAAPVLSLAVSPTSNSLYAGTEENGLWVSNDFGTTWQQIESDLISGPVNTIQMVGSEISLLLDDKMIFSSDSGQMWKIRHTFPFNQMAMTMLQQPDSVFVGFADGAILQLR